MSSDPYEELDAWHAAELARLARGEHTPKCVQVRAEHDAYVAKWPNYCRTCDASGGGYSYGPGYYDPPDWYECGDCTAKGLCPRCGQPDGFSGEEYDLGCTWCGYTYAEPDVCPPECCCHPDY